MKSITDKTVDGKDNQIPKSFLNYKTNQIIIALLFALAIGHAWHIRGSGPWGGMTGMWAVGIFTVLLIHIIFGNRKKASPTWIGLMVVLFALTVGGWGTLNSQITGRLRSSDFYDITVSPWSGAFYVFLIGFGWGPLFGFSLGYFMGDQKYSMKDFIGGIIIFYMGTWISKLLLAHPIIQITAPDAYELFAHALSESSSQTPWEFYLENFFSTGDLKAYAGGRNYEAMVSNLSDSIGTLFIWLYTKFTLKDKKGARYAIAIPLIIGASILLADFWIFWDKGCIFQADTPYDLNNPVALTGTYSCTAPEWLQGVGWGMWEYSTGFLFGLGLAIFLLKDKNKESMQSLNSEDTVFPEAIKNPITFITYYGIVIFAAVWFPIGSIISRWGETLEWSEKWENLYIIIISIAGLVYIGIYFFSRRKIKQGKKNYPQRPIQTHAFFLLVGYWIAFFVMDQFLTPYSSPDWRGMPAYLDITSFCIGLPLLTFVYLKNIKPREKFAKNIQDTQDT